MSDDVKELRARAAQLRAWDKFELGMSPPPARLDYLATAEMLQRAAATIERLQHAPDRFATVADKTAATK